MERANKKVEIFRMNEVRIYHFFYSYFFIAFWLLNGVIIWGYFSTEIPPLKVTSPSKTIASFVNTKIKISISEKLNKCENID